MGERLGFGVLGPLLVTVGGRTVPLGGARQRTVLALLLLSPGHVVPVDVLVHAVWDDRPPATARTQIAIVVAALRKALKAAGVAEEVIATAHPGYLLRVDGHRLDSLAFTRLVAEAEAAVRDRRPADAARCYAEALALWRGPALAGVGGRRVEDEATRWEEVRIQVREALTDVQLELGRHQLLLPELAAAVREHPLRERTRYHLILAQYRSGRRAEALEGFREARRRFIDELGMEPGPGLQELHDAILRDEPALSPGVPDAAPVTEAEEESVAPAGPGRRGRAAVPSELPPDVPGFAGRAEELGALDALLGGRADGTRAPTVGLVTGVAGVGKTGLAVRWAHRASGHYPDGRLFADLRGYDANHAPTAAGEILGRFLRSLGMASEDVPDGLEDRIAAYRSVLADRRVLLVLDNVRTPEQIRPLLPGSGGCTVLVTSREQLEQLVTWPASARIHLGLLPEDRSLELLAGIVGEARILGAPAESARLVELCDRLPLALRIAGARLASRPHWSVRHLVARLGDERRRLDELSQGELQVRASFALSYRCLDPDAARLHRLLGLLAVPDFTAWVAAELMDIGVLEAERLVEQLVDAQFLEVVGADATGQLRYRFHDLMRLYAGELARAEESEADRLAACDRVFRAWLTLAELAYRREVGGDYDIVHGDVPRRSIDPALAEELLADPGEWFEAERLCLIAVVEQSARAGAHDLAWDLVMCMRVLFQSRNYVEDWRSCSEHALAAARAAGNLRGQAAMYEQLGAVALRLRNVPEAVEKGETALGLYARAQDAHGRAIVLNNLGLVDRIRGDVEQGARRLREALRLSREVGDISLESYALQSLAQCALDEGRPQEGLELSREAVRIREALSFDGRGTALATHRLASAYLALGRLEEAEEAFAAVVRIVEENSDLLGLAHALLGLAETRHAAGAAEAAERTYLEALDLAQRQHGTLIEGQVRFGLGRLHQENGRPREGRVHLTAALGVFRLVGSPPWEAKATRALARPDPAPDPDPDPDPEPDQRYRTPPNEAISGR
ncbi:AfsR/SARP family transcriptional regulator [Streptomyces bambusae]|uniref:AfsR/SARP family transcriptional regulator n=1 Tax=Streptomyces bambusae TaxID=1550616 RepID=UPI001CA55A47|nr:BTAD domain-containing putative transcriptional regulator [Streptomyces bambusae]